jgi:hypothetical protein
METPWLPAMLLVWITALSGTLDARQQARFVRLCTGLVFARGRRTVLPVRYRRARAVDWLCKSDVTFSDAITGVRRYLWVEGVFSLSGHREAFEKLGGPLRQILLQGLAPAA